MVWRKIIQQDIPEITRTKQEWCTLPNAGKAVLKMRWRENCQVWQRGSMLRKRRDVDKDSNYKCI